ncbi:MAG: hypothetical protein F6K54_12100 [Okeania sp. SIO3B5]|uniref:hypothetical protein n=1 Tax=Okeania sp. SIO3B5 TaxID=2607811 RepID=UPI001401AD54|nr:hypothetical protein [Okeania sp. SIO3B5]NEO53756.1 hypothetical protein [Okeania sp. SIO3B5]
MPTTAAKKLIESSIILTHITIVATTPTNITKQPSTSSPLWRLKYIISMPIIVVASAIMSLFVRS